MTNTEQIRTKKISFILALSVIIFAAIATYFTLCHDINIMRITTPVILGLAMSIILCGVLQNYLHYVSLQFLISLFFSFYIVLN